MKIKITLEEIRKYLDIETPEFPKYVTPLINLANQFRQRRISSPLEGEESFLRNLGCPAACWGEVYIENVT